MARVGDLQLWLALSYLYLSRESAHVQNPSYLAGGRKLAGRVRVAII